MISYTDDFTQKKTQFVSIEGLSKIIHVMTLVHPFLEKMYRSSSANAEAMGFCLDWFEEFGKGQRLESIACMDQWQKKSDQQGKLFTDLDQNLVAFWGKVLFVKKSLSGGDLKNFVTFTGVQLSLFENFADQQRQQGAEDVALIMDKAFEDLTPLVTKADTLAADDGRLEFSVS